MQSRKRHCFSAPGIGKTSPTERFHPERPSTLRALGSVPPAWHSLTLVTSFAHLRYQKGNPPPHDVDITLTGLDWWEMHPGLNLVPS